MSKEENVVHAPPLPILPVEYSTGIYMYERLIENIHKGILFLNEVLGKQITYENFLQYSCRLADSLRTYGLNSENIVSVCCENCIEYFIPVIAGLFSGIPTSLVNPKCTEYELIQAFTLTTPAIVFCTVRNVEKIMVLKKSCPEIKGVIVIDSDISISGAWNLKEFIDKYSDHVDIYNYKPVAVDVENHIAHILFSSGTTGLPKGVMITHKNLNYKNASMRAPWLHVENQSQYILGFLPYFHVMGLHTVIDAIIMGCSIIVIDKFDFELHLEYVTKYKITRYFLVPPVLQMYIKSPLMDKYDLSHVEYVQIGGSPTRESLRKAVLQRTGIKSIAQGYGLTEITIAATLTGVGVNQPGTSGKLVPFLTGVVKDLKTGRNLGPNQNGELCFKGGMVMKGYYKNEAATKDAFTEDGYLRTGDIGYYDEEGFFYLEDRLKDLIKYKAYQVAPAELEDVLLTNPKVRKAAVIGIPDEDAGELPMAFVVKQPETNLTEQELVDYVKQFVAPTKYLRGGVVFVEDIPLTASGKILKKELRKLGQSTS